MAIRGQKSKPRAPLCLLRRSLRMPQRMLHITTHLLRLKITLRQQRIAARERVVDVMEELVKFTLLTRGVSPCLLDRYSERKESAAALSKRMNQRSI